MSVRLRIDLAYDGQAFSGWAKQPQHPSVQEVVEEALARVFRLEPAQVKTVVAGRTDAGVHATAQVCHVDVPGDAAKALATADGHNRLLRRLRSALGKNPRIRLHDIGLAPDGFDARFSPLFRRYEYRIADTGSFHDPRLAGYTVWRDDELDMAAMNDLGRALSGLHDFAAFCRARVGATTIRTLLEFSWTRDPHGVLISRVVADAFCHSMVRSLVGAAVAVGSQELGVSEVVALRDAGKRTSAWKTMPPQGLTLVEVKYPSNRELAARARQTRASRVAPTD